MIHIVRVLQQFAFLGIKPPYPTHREKEAADGDNANDGGCQFDLVGEFLAGFWLDWDCLGL